MLELGLGLGLGLGLHRNLFENDAYRQRCRLPSSQNDMQIIYSPGM